MGQPRQHPTDVPAGGFGRFIKTLRRAKGLSMQAFARQIGAAKGYISGIESGKTNPPSAKLVRKIATAFGQDPKTLMMLGFLEEVEGQLRAGVEKAEVFRTLRAKYHVSEEAVRYYAKRLEGIRQPGGSKAEEANPKKQAAPGKSRAKKVFRPKRAAKGPAEGPRTHPDIRSSPLRVLHVVKQLSQEDIKRALEAKKAMVELEAERERAMQLRRGLREAESKVRRLRKKLARMTL